MAIKIIAIEEITGLWPPPLILKMLAYQYNKCEEQREAWERAQREQWEADCNLRKEMITHR